MDKELELIQHHLTEKEKKWIERLQRQGIHHTLDIIGEIQPDGYEYRWVNIAKTVNDPFSKTVDDYADEGWKIVPYKRHEALLNYFHWKKGKMIPWISCGLSILVERKIPKGCNGYVELESEQTLKLTSQELL